MKKEIAIGYNKDVLSKAEYLGELIHRLSYVSNKEKCTSDLIYEATYAKMYIEELIESDRYSSLDGRLKQVLGDYKDIISIWLDGINYNKIQYDKQILKRSKLSKKKGNNGYKTFMGIHGAEYIGFGILSMVIILGLIIGVPFTEWVFMGSVIALIACIVGLIAGAGYDDGTGVRHKRAYLIASSLFVTGFSIWGTIWYYRAGVMAVWSILIDIVSIAVYYLLLYRSEYNGYRVVCYDAEGLNSERITKMLKVLSGNGGEAKEILDQVMDIERGMCGERGKGYWENLAKVEILYDKCLEKGLIGRKG